MTQKRKTRETTPAVPEQPVTVRSRLLAALANENGVPCPFKMGIPEGDNIGEVPFPAQAAYALALELHSEGMLLLQEAMTKLAKAKQIEKTARAIHGDGDPRAVDCQHVFIGADWRVAFGGHSIKEAVGKTEDQAWKAAFEQVFPGEGTSEPNLMDDILKEAMLNTERPSPQGMTPEGLGRMLARKRPRGARTPEMGGVITDPEQVRKHIGEIPFPVRNAAAKARDLPEDIRTFLLNPVGDVPTGLLIQILDPNTAAVAVDLRKRAH